MTRPTTPWPDAQRREFYYEIGLRLKVQRSRSRMTQDDLARAVGIPRPTYANIELGRQRIAADVIWRISIVLGCSVDALMPEPLARTADKEGT